MHAASLNHTFRLVWSDTLQAFIAVAENTKGRGKKSRAGRALGALTAVALASFALTGGAGAADLPTGGNVVAGSASISQSGKTLTVTQTSARMAADWQSFSIGAGNTVNFVQPSASSVALNRVLGSDVSSIQGAINANGQVFLINSNGVLFTSTAQVNVGSLVASTLNLSNANLMAGSYVFESNSQAAGAVVNQGSLAAAAGGYIALLAPEVRNEGVISAQLGTALLAAGNKVSLSLNNSNLLSYNIDQGALKALAENKHLIQADGGRVFMSASAADALSSAVVNNTGIIQARTVQNVGGVIKLMGDMALGTVNVGGTLDASAPNGGNGGFIETSAAHVQVAGSAKVTTLAPSGLSGTWLIDPVDFTVAATAGDMTGATLTSNLAGGNVTIQSSSGSSGTAGDINVNAAVTWTGAATLTLNAWRNININAALTSSNAAGKLALLYGQGATNGVVGGTTATYAINAPVNLMAGSNFSTKLGSSGSTASYTVITNLGNAGDEGVVGATNSLQGLAYSTRLAGNFVLGADIGASGTAAWNSPSGFSPIGSSTGRFTGIFDGLGHTITALAIYRPTTNYVGLFGATNSTAVVRNVGLLNVNVVGRNYVGGLIGSNYGKVSNSHSSGTVTGAGSVGGLVGGQGGNSYLGATIINSYATDDVTGTNSFVGGLVGTNYGTVTNSYATGSVSGSNYVGGLIGFGYAGTISNSYATGSVRGSIGVGGLVGYGNNSRLFPGQISNSYATGSVTGNSKTGGLVGWNNRAPISNSYATGYVRGGTGWSGGLVGFDYSGTYLGNFWNMTTSGRTVGLGFSYGSPSVATGLINADMHAQASFTPAGTSTGEWNFTSGNGTWVIYEGVSNPLLRSFMTPLTITANNVTKAYDGLAYNGSGSVTYSVAPVFSNLTGSLSYTGGINVGAYAITPSGLSAAPFQQGYIITYVDGTLTITAATTPATTPAADSSPDLAAALSALPKGASPNLVQAYVDNSQQQATAIVVRNGGMKLPADLAELE